MRKLLFLSVVSLVACAAGCNTCGRPSCTSPCSMLGSWRPWRSQQQCCQPACQPMTCQPHAECCNSCGGGGTAYTGTSAMYAGDGNVDGSMEGAVQGQVMMPAQSSCCN